MFQAHFAGDVLKFSAAQVSIQNALLAARWELPALKRVRTAQIKAPTAFFVSRVHAHIGHKQVQQAVLVEVEEDRSGGMGRAPDAEAGFQSDILEFSAAEILE